ncbi:6-phosphofructokinase [Burkholderia sp. YI23]|nr:6-phosphofructokinase [Burkholderia sp. YI23]
MTAIVTVTFNPAVDVATSVDVVLDTQKLRCAPARRDPGGGGINVARVVQRLGGDCVAFYLAGGPAGGMLSALLNAEQASSADSSGRSAGPRHLTTQPAMASRPLRRHR